MAGRHQPDRRVLDQLFSWLRREIEAHATELVGSETGVTSSCSVDTWTVPDLVDTRS